MPLDAGLTVSQACRSDLGALHDELTELAAIPPLKNRVVELRFFGGLTTEETAEAVHASQDTIFRDWELAKVWRLQRLEAG